MSGSDGRSLVCLKLLGRKPQFLYENELLKLIHVWFISSLVVVGLVF